MLTRRYDPEIMDDPSVEREEMARALGELKNVNRFLGGKSTTRKGFRILQEKLQRASPLAVLDIGAGGADVFDGLAQSMNITLLDRHQRVCEYLRNGAHAIVCGDARHLPFRDRSFDVVHASMFLHHLHEEEIRNVLLSSVRIARQGVIINDLRRSPLAYAGIRILTTLFSKSEMVKHDGPLSVLRGFSRRELTGLLAQCGIDNYVLQRRWAFRWLIVAWR